MKHGVIEHGKKEFSKDGITTNSIEGFWGHFKRMVFGTYHSLARITFRGILTRRCTAIIHVVVSRVSVLLICFVSP